MELYKNKKILIISIFVIIVVFVLGLNQFLFLKKAHSTFENYYEFRGCIKLIEKTDTYGMCELSSGKQIKLVKFQDKWYLDGDLPYPGFNFL